MTEWLYCPECRAPLFIEPSADAPLSCPSGHFRKYDNPVPSTIAMIEHEGRFLLLRRAREPELGRWDAVGGFVQGGESAEECLVREAAEETGLIVLPTHFVGTYPSVYGGTGVRTLGLAYRCVVEGDRCDVKLSEENSEFAWFMPLEIPDLAFADVREAFGTLMG